MVLLCPTSLFSLWASIPTLYRLPLHLNQILVIQKKNSCVAKNNLLETYVPRTAVLQALAQCLYIPGSLLGTSVGDVILQGGHAQEEVCLCRDALELKPRILLHRRILLSRICFDGHTLMESITLAGLNKKDFWFSSKWIAILCSERSGQFSDRYFLPINTIYNAFFPMRQDTANKTVLVLMVSTPEDVHSLTDFFCSEISIFFYCKMKLAKDIPQSRWKAKRREIWDISLYGSWTLQLQIAFLDITGHLLHDYIRVATFLVWKYSSSLITNHISTVFP